MIFQNIRFNVYLESADVVKVRIFVFKSKDTFCITREEPLDTILAYTAPYPSIERMYIVGLHVNEPLPPFCPIESKNNL